MEQLNVVAEINGLQAFDYTGLGSLVAGDVPRSSNITVCCGCALGVS